MRARPFLSAGEPSRPFSEVCADRGDFLGDDCRRVLAEVARLEAEADIASDPAQRKRLLCEAEAWRCALVETK